MQDRIECKSRLESRIAKLQLGELLGVGDDDAKTSAFQPVEGIVTTSFVRVEDLRTAQFVKFSEPYERIEVALSEPSIDSYERVEIQLAGASEPYEKIEIELEVSMSASLELADIEQAVSTSVALQLSDIELVKIDESNLHEIEELEFESPARAWSVHPVLVAGVVLLATFGAAVGVSLLAFGS